MPSSTRQTWTLPSVAPAHEPRAVGTRLDGVDVVDGSEAPAVAGRRSRSQILTVRSQPAEAASRPSPGNRDRGDPAAMTVRRATSFFHADPTSRACRRRWPRPPGVARQEGDVVDRGLVAVQAGEHRLLRQVPENEAVVEARGERALAIGGDRHALDRPAMLVERRRPPPPPAPERSSARASGLSRADAHPFLPPRPSMATSADLAAAARRGRVAGAPAADLGRARWLGAHLAEHWPVSPSTSRVLTRNAAL